MECAEHVDRLGVFHRMWFISVFTFACFDICNICKKWLQHVQRMDTNRLSKRALQYKPKDEGTLDDRGRDGGANFILSIKEQETRLTFQADDDDDDDMYKCRRPFFTSIQNNFTFVI